MSEHDTNADAADHNQRDDAHTERRLGINRRTALSAGGAGIAAMLLDAAGSRVATAGAATRTTPVDSIFGVRGGYHFAFINHATADTFFTPTVNGIEDACSLLSCSFSWTGSNSSNVGQVASAIRTATAGGVDGIATTLISPALAAPVRAAMAAGIPVVSYNADEPSIDRLAYIGQDLLASGRAMGRKIKQLIPHGGPVAVFIAVPGSAGLQPRLDGITQELKGSNITLVTPASGAGQQQDVTTIESFVQRHTTSYKGYFAVDAGSTEAVALALQKYNLQGKVVAGGFDLTADTETLLHEGAIQFAIDQQPYLQGFLATVELFLYKATQGLTGAADVDTGLKFLDRRTVKPYATTRSRYEGSSTAPGVQKA
jgi:simple sugar transport system substrate-binding protein